MKKIGPRHKFASKLEAALIHCLLGSKEYTTKTMLKYFQREAEFTWEMIGDEQLIFPVGTTFSTTWEGDKLTGSEQILVGLGTMQIFLFKEDLDIARIRIALEKKRSIICQYSLRGWKNTDREWSFQKNLLALFLWKLTFAVAAQHAAWMISSITHHRSNPGVQVIVSRMI